MKSNDPKRQCSYQNPKTGRACRAWAVRGSHPPYCYAHLPRTPSLAYSEPPAAANLPSPSEGEGPGVRVQFPPTNYQDIADLFQDEENPLDGEVANARAAVRQIFARLHDELEPLEFARIIGLVFTGSNTVANLLRTQRALTGQAADGLVGAVAQALDEIATEWGLHL